MSEVVADGAELTLRRIARATGRSLDQVRADAGSRMVVAEPSRLFGLMAGAYEELIGGGFTPPRAREWLREAAAPYLQPHELDAAMERAEMLLMERLFR